MEIELLNKQELSNIIVASARSCYNSKLFKPQDVDNWNRKDQLLEDLFKSGHYTTFMHSNLVLGIKGMSRFLIWRLLHSHEFYNSDQVSQRYVKMKKENFYYPENLDKEELDKLYNEIFQTYDELVDILGRGTKANEDARYILPQSMEANLYHTINVITAIRYIVISPHLDVCRSEAIEFANKLEKIILDIDPSFKPIIERAKKTKVDLPKIDIDKLPRMFNGNVTIFDIIEPINYSGEINYLQPLKLNSLQHNIDGLYGFTTKMLISFAGDAQNQRHRKSYGVRPYIKDYFKNHDIKYFIPTSINNNDKAKKLYTNIIEKMLKYVEDNIEFNSDVLYLLPNAYSFEIVERNDFNSFVHKAQMRMCLNAQEELRNITYNIVHLLYKEGINVTMLGPICVGRYDKNIKPFCTEGPRFCGIKMWKPENFYKEFENFKNIYLKYKGS